MKRFLLLAPLVLVLSVSASAAPRRAPKGWKKYNGPWFSVYYPATWKAAAGKSPASTGGGKLDTASFSSPDGRAQFAIYAPMWNGQPTDLNIDTKREKRVSRMVVASTDSIKSKIETRWQTFRALNGGYTRSIVDVENKTLNTRRVLGFRYKDAATYNRYLPQFQKFKSSLIQYTD